MTSPSLQSFMPSIVLENEMNVKKRNGQLETVSFDKILQRIKRIGKEVGINVNYTSLAMKVIDQLYDGISTTKIDELSAEQCASMAAIHYDYNILAGRILISSHQKNTNDSFSEVMKTLYNYPDKHGKPSPLVSDELYQYVLENGDILDRICDYSRDFLIDYFGFKTLDRAYLMRINGKIVERPQHMFLRVAIGIHGDEINNIIETYDLMSQKYFTHATPTLFNSGTPRPQLSSCFLIAMENDSIEGIYNTVKDCALISKYAGGIGLHIHNIRATGSHIRGTNGKSNGIVPMLKVFNHTAKYVDQCLDPDTIVYTKTGPKPIKRVVVGDKVICDDGWFHTIGKVLDNTYSGDLYTIYMLNAMYPLKATDMHPLWAIQMDEKAESIEVINQLNARLIAPDFIEAKHIKTNDFVGFPIPIFERDIAHYSEEDCRFYGILFSAVYLYGNSESDYPTRVNIELDTNIHSATLDFIEIYLQEHNYPFSVHYSPPDENKKMATIQWESRENSMIKFTHEMLYDESGMEIMMPAMMHLPKHKLGQLLRGILEPRIENPKGTFAIRFNSLKFIEQLRYILMRFGILTTGAIIQNNNLVLIPKTKTVCDLIPNISENVSQSFFEYNGYIFSRVSDNIVRNNYTGRVIDIEVNNADHHNFLTHSGLVKNGGGKRNGSFAIYIEPWHADIDAFLQMRKNHGDEELKARDLFYALWIPDLFMERIKSNGTWTLMCPDECPGLADVYGDAFKTLYERYESENRGRITINARDLWFKIMDAQMETGMPYILYKDACNKKSNQQNVGTIKSSNLCSEIVQYSDDTETAVCNLASIGLPTFINQNTGEFDYEKLHEVAKVITKNLNKIIDVNFYPTEKTRKSNMRHRPIGIGVQGLADVFMTMGHAFTSDAAKEINRNIFETIYHAALESSCELAEDQTPYETFAGSPASRGILQFDMWGVEPSARYDWADLKSQIQRHGLRNSLLLAPMPTASTSQILGFNECIEPITSNIYSRSTIAGQFIQANRYMMRDLLQLGLWNETIKNNIIANHGSIQQIDLIPQDIKEKYKTVWEIPMRHLIDMAADRGAFICQSQSLNLWLEDPTYSTLTSMHFYSWQKGLKTGIYYLRRRGKHQAQQFTIEPEKAQHTNQQEEICDMCSS